MRRNRNRFEFVKNQPEYSTNELADRMRMSDTTIRKYARLGLIKPARVETKVVEIPIYSQETVDYMCSPAFEEAVRLTRPETWEEKQKRLGTQEPRKPRKSKPRRLAQPGFVRVLGNPEKIAELEKDDALTFEFEQPVIPKKERVVLPDPVELQKEREALVPRVAESPPPESSPPEIPRVDLDEYLRSLEGFLSKSEYRFLLKGVTILKTDGANYHEQKAFIDEYMKPREDATEDYDEDCDG